MLYRLLSCQSTIFSSPPHKILLTKELKRQSISTNLRIDPMTKLHKEKTTKSSKKILLIFKNQLSIKLSINTQQGEI